MNALSPAPTVERMVPVALPAYVERTTVDELLAAANELVARLEYLATASALPGDEAVRWHDEHEECAAIVETIGAGLVVLGRPE